MSISSLIKRCWADYKREAAKQGICASEFEAFRCTPKNVVGKTLLRIGESLFGYWDSLVKDGWGSLDARTLHPTFRDGTIREGFKRTWLAPAPVGSEIEIIVKKRIASGMFPGTLGGTVTASKYNEDGNVIETKKITFKDGKYESTKEISFSDSKFGFIAVEVDTPHKPGKSFAYSIRYKEKVVKAETRPVVGFADIHVHQTAEDAYAGNWLHGSMMGNAADVLKPCSPNQHKGKLVNLGIKTEVDPKDPTGSIRIVEGGGYPSFREWPHHLDIAHQQVHENWLKQAFQGGMKLMVSSAVNSEVLAFALGAVWDKDVWRDMNALYKQIDKIHQFCERNKSWAAIAYNPWHAREIIHSGKLAIVIAVECSNLFPKDQGDYLAQLAELYCKGVRSIQIVHHCDNRFAGAAPQERQLVGIQTLSRLSRISLKDSRKHIIDQGLPAYFSEDKDKPFGFEFDSKGLNVRGLSHEGEKLIQEIMRRHMLIDVSHYSSRTFDDVYDLARGNDYYPLFYSHTKFQSILSKEEQDVQREFLTTDDQLEKIKDTGGMVGLRTAPWSDQKPCCGIHAPVQTDQKGEIGTARNFAQQVAYAYQKNIDFALGTDFNGFTNQLGPRRKHGPKPTSLSSTYWNKGLCHIGMLPDLVEDLRVLNAHGANEFDSSAEKFLKMWERTWDKNRKRVVRRERNLKMQNPVIQPQKIEITEKRPLREIFKKK